MKAVRHAVGLQYERVASDWLTSTQYKRNLKVGQTVFLVASCSSTVLCFVGA